MEEALKEPEVATKRKATMDSLARTGALPQKEDTDPSLEALKTEVQLATDQNLREQIEATLVDPTTDLNQKTKTVGALTPLLGKKPTALEAFTATMATNAKAKGPDRAVQQAVIEHAKEIADLSTQEELIRRGALLNFDPLSSPKVWLSDLLEIAFLPGTFAPPIIEVIESAFPGLTSTQDQLLVGDAVELFKEEMAKLPPEERVEKLKAVSKTIDELEALGFIDNNIMKMDVAQALFDSPYDEDWERRLDNVIGLLDYAVFSGLFLSGARLGKAVVKAFKRVPNDLSKEGMKRGLRQSRHRPSVLSTLDEVDPVLSKELKHLILSDTSGKIAGELGETVDVVTAESVLPKINDPVVRPGPDLNDSGYGLMMFSPAELTTLQQGVEAGVKQARDTVMSGQTVISKYNFDVNPNAYEADVIVAASDTHGFSSLKQARAALKGYREVLETAFVEPEILARNWSKGEFEPLTHFRAGKEPFTKGEYLIRFKVSEPFTSRFAKAEGIATGEGATGTRAKYLDKDSWATPWFTKAAAQASDKSSLRIARLRSTIKPYTSLNILDAQTVLKELQFSADNEVWLTRSDLLREWAHFSDKKKVKLIQAYESVVKHQKLIREYHNDALYRKLYGMDAKEITLRGVDGAKIKRIITYLDNPPIDLRHIFDTSTMDVRAIDPIQWDALKEKGWKVVRFETRMHGDKTTFDYGLVPPKSKNVTVGELPKELIPDIPGYFTRYYDAGATVVQIEKRTVNGVVKNDWERVVGIESSFRSAKELVEQLQADAIAKYGADSPDLPKYEWRRAKELVNNSQYYDPFNLEHLEDVGQLYTGGRGPEQLGKRDKVTGRRRRIVKPLADSIEASAIHAARIGAQDILVDKLIANWEKMYAKDFGVAKYDSSQRVIGKTMPWSRDQIPGSSVPGQNLVREDAIAMLEQIRMIAGIDRITTQQTIEEFIVNYAERVLQTSDSKWRGIASDALLKSRGLGLITKTKALAFFQLITMKPVRQAILQANQMALYWGRDDALTYFAGKGTRDLAGLVSGTVAHSMGWLDNIAPSMAKGMGMSVDDYKQFIQSYVDSGLPAAIDSHLWTAPLQVQPSVTGVTMGVKGYLKEATTRRWRTFAKFIRRAGFDSGEQVQLMTAFLAEKNAWQKANPTIAHKWHLPKYRDDIAAEARRLSFNMNSLGALGFQNGIWSPMFQFMSHTTKSLQAVVPNNIPFTRTKIPGLSVIANKKFSDAEKYRMLIAHTLLYGTGGFYGATEGYEWLKAKYSAEPPSDFDMIVEEGALGTALNLSLRATSGDETLNLEASKSLSPLGGTSPIGNPIGKVLDYIIYQDQSPDEFLGPGYTVFKRMVKGLPVLEHIMFGAPYLSNPEKFEAAAMEIARSSLLTFDDYERSLFERAVGRYLSQNGNVGTSATNTEILTKLLLSVRTRSDNRIRQARVDVLGIHGDPLVDPELGDYVNKTSKDSAEKIQRVMQLLQRGEMTGDDVADIIRQMSEKYEMLYGGYDGPDGAAHGLYLAALGKRMANWVEELTPGSNQYELGLTNAILKGWVGSPQDERQQMFDKLNAVPDFPHKEDLIEGLRYQYEMD